MDLCDMYNRFLHKYHDFLKSIRCNIENAFKKEEKRLKKLMIYKFISLHLHAFAISSMYMEMQENPDRGYYIMVALNTMQGLYLLTANLQFMLVLCQMNLRFSYINLSLEALQHEKFPANDLLNYYLILYKMHMECFQMARLVLKSSKTVTFFMLLKIFTTNIIILYHAVLVIMSTLHSNNTGNLIGTLCIVNFYWDTLLITTAIDQVLASCNRTASILQATCFELRRREDLEMFAKLTQLVSNENH
ncbi:putative gustatory receptor 58a [Calliphora vicina]|uniref:putative gustatory receptor 58a n=1 Tax=Calliphora vicina TaxID=7373 RepID=UPI00325BC7BB